MACQNLCLVSPYVPPSKTLEELQRRHQETLEWWEAQPFKGSLEDRNEAREGLLRHFAKEQERFREEEG